MKKLLAIFLIIVLSASVVACADNDAASGSETSSVEQTETASSNEAVSENKSENKSDNKAESEKQAEDEIASSENNDWKQLLKEYEEWVDKSLAVIKKYTEDPTDNSVASEYKSIMSEFDEWHEKAADMQQELEKLSSDELEEYKEKLEAIELKLFEVILANFAE